MSCSDSLCLNLVWEISVSSFRDFCSSFQSLAVENWKERVCFGGDQRYTPAGARATGGCCYGDKRAEIRGDFT